MMNFIAHFDASYRDGSAKAGIVIRTSDKKLIHKSSIVVENVEDSMDGEFIAALELIKTISDLKIDSVLIIGDCSGVIRALKKNLNKAWKKKMKIKNKYRKYINEANEYIQSIQEYKFQWVRRADNKIAHKLTK